MNFELVTIKKGEIKTVDAFIKSFNAVGYNMRALSVSAYKFLTDENIEVRKEFKTRCLDELNMSSASISFLKTSGMLYSTSDVFYDFPYTNVVLFKKAIDHYIEKNYPNKLAWEFVDDDICENVICELAKLHYSRVDENDTEECKLQLLALSQKELRHLVDVYASDKVVEDTSEDTSEDATEDTIEDTSEDSTPTDEEMEEVNSHYITYIDDDIYEIISMLSDVNIKMSKQSLIDVMKSAVDKLNGGMRK